MSHVSIRSLALLLSLGAAPALAADLAPVVPEAGPAFFQGLYVGGQLGATVAGERRDPLAGSLNLGAGFADLGNAVAASGGAFTDERDDTAFLGGIHIGYDWQSGPAVIGAVADIGYSDASFASGARIGAPGAGITVRQDLDYVGSARLRAGYAFDQVLLYATGGLAFAGQSTSSDLSGGASGLATRVEGDDTLFGYTVGAGLDYALTPNISIGAQYLYTRFEDAGVTATVANPFGPAAGPDFKFKTDDKIDFHRVEAKISYRFN